MDFDSPFTDKIIDLPALGAVRAVKGPIFYYGHPGHPMIALEFHNSTNTVNLQTAHLDLDNALKSPSGPELTLCIRWTDVIREIRLPEQWPYERAEHAASSQDLEEATKLLRYLLQKMKNGPALTQRGTFKEFLDLLQAMADLTGQFVRVSVPPFARKEGHPSQAPEFASRADPVTLRMPIRQALLWFEPSRKMLFLGNKMVEWGAYHLGLPADRDPSGHRRIEAAQIVSGFYERAKSDLKLTPADIRKALGKFGLSE